MTKQITPTLAVDPERVAYITTHHAPPGWASMVLDNGVTVTVSDDDAAALIALYPAAATRSPEQAPVLTLEGVNQYITESILRGGSGVSRAMDGLRRSAGGVNGSNCASAGGQPSGVSVTVRNQAHDQGVSVAATQDTEGNITLNISDDGRNGKFVRDGSLRYGKDRIYLVTGDDVTRSPILEISLSDGLNLTHEDQSEKEREQTISALRWYAGVLERQGK